MLTIVETPDLSARDFSENEYSDLMVAMRAKVTGTDVHRVVLVPVLVEREVLETVALRPGDELKVRLVDGDVVSERWSRAQRIDELMGERSGGEFYALDPLLVKQGTHVDPDIDRSDGKKARDGEFRLPMEEGRAPVEEGDAKLSEFRNAASDAVEWSEGISLPEKRAIEATSFRGPISAIGISPAAAVSQLATQLEKREIGFLYVSIPLRSEIYPEWFGGETDLETGGPRLEFLKLLGEIGVDFFDAGVPLKAEKRKRGEDFRPFWKAKDAHLTPQGHAVIASALGDYLRENGWLEGLEISDFEMKSFKLEAPNRPDLSMFVRQVIVPKTNPESPIFLAGDSNVFFYQTVMMQGGGLPSQLAAETGYYVDWKSIAGMQPHTFGKYGAGVFRGKKLVIFIHTSWLLADERAPMMPVQLQAE